MCLDKASGYSFAYVPLFSPQTHPEVGSFCLLYPVFITSLTARVTPARAVHFRLGHRISLIILSIGLKLLYLDFNLPL